MDGYPIRYLNLPKLRHGLKFRASERTLQRVFRKHGKPWIAVFWNIDRYNSFFFQRLKLDLRVPCLVLAADVPVPGAVGAEQYAERCREAVGVVYLSWSAFEESPVSNKMHLDGGVSKAAAPERLGVRCTPEPFLLYSGMFLPYSGVDYLLDAFGLTAGDLRLTVCGDCRDARLFTRFGKNPRVDYRGFVSEGELESLSRKAFAFVNPYLLSAPETRGKFPSKVLEYLSYGRPVISTRTSGFAPDYADVVRFVAGEDPVQLAHEITAASALDEAARAEQWNRCQAFLETRTWERQGERFLSFAEQITRSHF
jgi:glycosyltransferase involved in cell wall biosynthesis